MTEPTDPLDLMFTPEMREELRGQLAALGITARPEASARELILNSLNCSLQNMVDKLTSMESTVLSLAHVMTLPREHMSIGGALESLGAARRLLGFSAMRRLALAIGGEEAYFRLVPHDDRNPATKPAPSGATN